MLSPTKAVLCEFQAQSHTLLRFTCTIGVLFSKIHVLISRTVCDAHKTKLLFSMCEIVVLLILLLNQENGLSVVKDTNCKLSLRIQTLKSSD